MCRKEGEIQVNVETEEDATPEDNSIYYFFLYLTVMIILAFILFAAIFYSNSKSRVRHA